MPPIRTSIARASACSIPPWTTRIVSAVAGPSDALGPDDAAAGAAFGEVVATRGLVTGAVGAAFVAAGAAFVAAGFGAAGFDEPVLAGEVRAARGGRGLAVGFGVGSAMAWVPRV
jgi:hypothetical protein